MTYISSLLKDVTTHHWISELFILAIAYTKLKVAFDIKILITTNQLSSAARTWHFLIPASPANLLHRSPYCRAMAPQHQWQRCNVELGSQRYLSVV